MADLTTFSNNVDSERFEKTMQSTPVVGLKKLYLSSEGIPKEPYFNKLENATIRYISDNRNIDANIWETYSGSRPAISFVGTWKSASSHVLTYFELDKKGQDWADNSEVPEPPSVDLWTPSELTTSLWLDAADSETITVDGSNNVTAWQDKSGNGRDAVSEGSSEPSLSGTFVSFQGSEYLVISGTVPVSNDMSVFVVFSRSAGVLSLPLGGSVSNEPPYATYWDGTNTIYSGLGSTGFTMHGSSSVTGNVLHLLTRGSGQVELWQNGATVGGPKSSLSGTGSFVYVGRRASNYMVGDIAEIVMTPSALSSADRQKVEGYLAWKWGLEGFLPSGHPYKSAAPIL